MYKPTFLATWLLPAAVALGTVAATAGPPVVVAIADDNALAAPLVVRDVRLLDEDDVVLHKAEELPKTWIGVRVTTVPEPLAAHLKRSGLMIANVAEDSPADHAGLERYDVVVSLDGREINEMDDLLAAVKDVGTARKVAMVVIRGGAEIELQIRPVKRQDAGEVTFKYDEPEELPGDQLERYFGHRFKVGPDGRAVVIPFGRLDRLPDDIEELLDDLPDIDIDLRGQLGDLYKQGDLPRSFKFDLDDFGDIRWRTFDDDDPDARTEIHIRIQEGDETIKIEKSEDGTITIERQSADGNRSSRTYESSEKLREEDPEAFKLYSRHILDHGHGAFFIAPDMKNLGVQQKEFQIELREQLDKVRDQVRKAVEDAEKASRRVEIRKYGVQEDDDFSHSKTVEIRIGDDGRITLEISENGEKRKYEFESREDFRQAEPELYERYMQHLDANPETRAECAESAAIA